MQRSNISFDGDASRQAGASLAALAAVAVVLVIGGIISGIVLGVDRVETIKVGLLVLVCAPYMALLRVASSALRGGSKVGFYAFAALAVLAAGIFWA